MSTLSLQRISKKYKNTEAVRDVSLEIVSGEFVSILGPSGCGKTTLLRIIAGLELPDSGALILDGKNITSTPAQYRGIGMVFQNYALFPHMTVFQNIAFGLQTKGVAKPEIRLRVEKILEAVHLSHKIDTPVPHLSGGEQQRVAVARALVVEPAVLLFDEPLSNLDVALRSSTREEIRALQRRTGITTVYVTHDQAEAMSLSDRVAVMNSGCLIQVGPPLEIYEHPESVFAAEFLGGANILHGNFDLGSRMFVSGLLRMNVPREKRVEGGRIVLAVKPEAILFQQSPDDEPHPATILEKEYLGFTTTFRLEVHGVSLRCTALSSGIAAKLAPGDVCKVKFDWSKIATLPET